MCQRAEVNPRRKKAHLLEKIAALKNKVSTSVTHGHSVTASEGGMDPTVADRDLSTSTTGGAVHSAGDAEACSEKQLHVSRAAKTLTASATSFDIIISSM